MMFELYTIMLSGCGDGIFDGIGESKLLIFKGFSLEEIRCSLDGTFLSQVPKT
jgi:hypothetical protein